MALKSALINVMVNAAMKAARNLRRDFGEVEQLQVSRKGPADFVSKADQKAESIIFETLSEARPDYGFVMEERGEVEGKGLARFIIDPLDGTTNFLHGLPHWAISIAAEERGDITAGIVYDPVKDELFWAERGRGAFLNETRLRVANRNHLDTALLATGIPYRGRPGHPKFIAQAEAFMEEVAGIRRFGSAALDLAYVAAGRYDGFWEEGLSIWDVAAGILIVREAGGYVTDTAGKQTMLESGNILAANDRLHVRMERILKGVSRKTGFS